MVLKNIVAAEAVVANWYKHFVPAFAREVLEGSFLWATKNAERYERFQNSITFMMLLFFISRKILLGLLGLVWMVRSFLLGSIWAIFYILVRSIWAAISLVVGLIWSAVPFMIVSAMVFYAILFLIKKKEFVFSVIAACFGLLLLYRSASFSLLNTVYLIVMETLVVSVIYLMIKESMPERRQSKTFGKSFDPSNRYY